MLLIGLTGGIASGKSAAAACFEALGAPVIDADQIGRELVVPGSPLLEALVSVFGAHVLLPDGSLDRAALGTQIFGDAEQRHRLEALMHPAIRAEMLARAQQLDAPYVVLVVPLLVEAGMVDLVDRVLVIDVPETLQRQRITQRDGHGAERIDQVLAAQTDRATRLAAADDVIVNDGDVDDLCAAVARLHRQYGKPDTAL